MVQSSAFMFDTPTSDPSAGPHARFTLVSHHHDDDSEDVGVDNDDYMNKDDSANDADDD